MLQTHTIEARVRTRPSATAAYGRFSDWVVIVRDADTDLREAGTNEVPLVQVMCLYPFHLPITMLVMLSTCGLLVRKMASMSSGCEPSKTTCLRTKA